MKCQPKILEIWKSRGNRFWYGLVAPASAASILCKPVGDVASRWVQAFFWSTGVYDVVFVSFCDFYETPYYTQATHKPNRFLY